MAIIETALAVAFYWWVAVKFDAYLPLAVSIAIAPLVLLRSEQSTKLGVKWFTAWEMSFWSHNWRFGELTSRVRYLMLTLGVLSILLACIATFYIVQFPFPKDDNVSAFWRSFALAWICTTVSGTVVGGLSGSGPLTSRAMDATFIAMIGLFCTKVALFDGIKAVIDNHTLVSIGSMGLGYSASLVIGGVELGPLGISLTVRIGATIRHFWAGLKTLPQNFRRLTLCTSPLQEPELVPGLVAGETIFTLRSRLNAFTQMLRSRSFEDKANAVMEIAPGILVWFFPGWFYRVTLKSTAWFWWPLAFLSGPPRLSNNPNWFYEQITATKLARTLRPFAYGTVIAFLAVNIERTINEGKLPENPFLSTFGYALSIDWSATPWQLLGVIGSALSLIVLYWIDWNFRKYCVATDTQDTALAKEARRHFRWIEYLARVRTLLFLAYCVIVGFHALLVLNARSCWFTPSSNVQAWSLSLYGKHLPDVTCGHRDGGPF
jgi:hypothetical protein